LAQLGKLELHVLGRHPAPVIRAAQVYPEQKKTPASVNWSG